MISRGRKRNITDRQRNITDYISASVDTPRAIEKRSRSSRPDGICRSAPGFKISRPEASPHFRPEANEPNRDRQGVGRSAAARLLTRAVRFSSLSESGGIHQPPGLYAPLLPGVVVASYKGGAGKTALAVPIAERLAFAGMRVLLMTCDTQEDARYRLGVDRGERRGAKERGRNPRFPTSLRGRG